MSEVACAAERDGLGGESQGDAQVPSQQTLRLSGSRNQRGPQARGTIGDPPLTTNSPLIHNPNKTKYFSCIPTAIRFLKYREGLIVKLRDRRYAFFRGNYLKRGSEEAACCIGR